MYVSRLNDFILSRSRHQRISGIYYHIQMRKSPITFPFHAIFFSFSWRNERLEVTNVSRFKAQNVNIIIEAYNDETSPNLYILKERRIIAHLSHRIQLLFSRVSCEANQPVKILYLTCVLMYTNVNIKAFFYCLGWFVNSPLCNYGETHINIP